MKPKDQKSSRDEKSISKDTAPKKKAYRPPKLVAYGHIREITKTLSVNSGTDNAVLPSKTGL